MRTGESRNYVLFLIVLLGLSVAYVIYSVPLGIISDRGRFGSGLFPVVVGTLLVVLVSGVLLKTLFSKTDEGVTTAEDEDIQVAAAVLGLEENVAAERAERTSTVDGAGSEAPRNDAGDPPDDVGDPRAAMYAIPQGDAGGAVQVLLGVACIAFFIIVWEFVDTVVATVLYVCLATFVLGGRKQWWKFTLLGLIFPVFAYLLFTQALGVRLP
jgi:Tripartite tricarboxylate transporter TctB family